jgi:hypothetical protein
MVLGALLAWPGLSHDKMMTQESELETAAHDCGPAAVKTQIGESLVALSLLNRHSHRLIDWLCFPKGRGRLYVCVVFCPKDLRTRGESRPQPAFWSQDWGPGSPRAQGRKEPCVVKRAGSGLSQLPGSFPASIALLTSS